MINKRVLIRTVNAGVHFGTLEARDSRALECLLSDSRRIWKWSGANTLNEISKRGISGGRVSEPVSEIILAQVIEILPLSEEADQCLKTIGWQK